MCLVGVHPDFDLIYRRLRATSSNLDVTLTARARPTVAGRVINGDAFQPVPHFRLVTSLDGIRAGDYLGAAGKIPTGHEFGNFPLPPLDLPMLVQKTDGRGRFRVTFDSAVRHGVALRFQAPGLRSRTVTREGLTRRRVVNLTSRAATRVKTAHILLTVNLAGSP